VQAFLLEPDGSSSARIAVSTNGGASFVAQPLLASLPYRGGGRLASAGGKLLFVYDGHDDGTHAARFRLRDDSAPLSEWSAATVAFAEGIYHGAAASTAADGAGGLQLVYKDKAGRLWLRRFAAGSFGARQLVDDSGGWELQPATTRVGSDLVVYYNRVIATGYRDEVRVRLVHDGLLGASQLLDGSASFKGYPAAMELLPAGADQVPCLFGVTADANSAGQATLYAIDWSGGAPPPVDMAQAPGGPADAGARSCSATASTARSRPTTASAPAGP
jgi:hypothetical protein